MGMFDFIKDVGAKIGIGGEADPTPEQLKKELDDFHLKVDDLSLDFNEGVVTIGGKVKSQSVRERSILAMGNVNGVQQVVDNLVVAEPEKESVFYTVKSGDSLSKIAKNHYGNAMKYPVIFEANKPMLKDPNKIYPGQVLRIPELED